MHLLLNVQKRTPICQMVRTGTILLINFLRLWDLLNDQQYGFVVLICMIQHSVMAMKTLILNVVDQILACVIDESVGISTMALEDGVQVAINGLISIIHSENICIIVRLQLQLLQLLQLPASAATLGRILQRQGLRQPVPVRHVHQTHSLQLDRAAVFAMQGRMV
jgi:hypothetical protein